MRYLPAPSGSATGAPAFSGDSAARVFASLTRPRSAESNAPLMGHSSRANTANVIPSSSFSADTTSESGSRSRARAWSPRRGRSPGRGGRRPCRRTRPCRRRNQRAEERERPLVPAVVTRAGASERNAGEEENGCANLLLRLTSRWRSSNEPWRTARVGVSLPRAATLAHPRPEKRPEEETEDRPIDRARSAVCVLHRACLLHRLAARAAWRRYLIPFSCSFRLSAAPPTSQSEPGCASGSTPDDA